MYNTILVPLDGSKRSEAILPHVEQMAQHYNSEVILMLVEEGPLLLGRDEIIDLSVYKQNLNKREKEVQAYLDEREKEFSDKGIRVRTVTAHAPVVKAILNAAKNENADIIAIASHGITGLDRSSYGSVAAGILQHIDRPLLLIRSLDHK